MASMDFHSDDNLDEQWRHIIAVVSPALALADPAFVARIRHECEVQGIQDAVQRHDTAAIFDWLLEKMQYQGMSDANVNRFLKANPTAAWSELREGVEAASCSRLTSYWHFAECGFRKLRRTCADADLLPSCPLPGHPFRNGRLSQAAYSLFLFIRDVCAGDLVAWIDMRLETAAGGGGLSGNHVLRSAILEPMSNIYGLGHKILSMSLSDLLIGADPQRQTWVSAGASLIAIDTLVHKFLQRTGILRRRGGDHPYGPACYQKDGCADIIEDISSRIDARSINSDFPACFPRYVQHAIWRFCAQSQLDICNGNRIDDRRGCQRRFCPTYADCDRLPLHDRAKHGWLRH